MIQVYEHLLHKIFLVVYLILNVLYENLFEKKQILK
jgi:hypothetical protein